MEKTFTATQKYLLMSPRKIRLVIALIKKLSPIQAVEKLPFVQKRAGLEVAKVIKAAMASAKNQGVSETDLFFKEIRAGEGPRLKRGIAVSRGQWHPITKRMSHIRVVLGTKKIEPKEKEVKETKEIKVEEKGEKNGTKS
ncbi:MAG TPA: uL22 family ribosomal protein [Patescibacteria group bacterium]|nr:uL22 family ribosomal protein [Patescibacteria group bacterium]